MWGDESEAVAPIIWLYQIVDAQKEEVFFPDLLITLRSYAQIQGQVWYDWYDSPYQMEWEVLVWYQGWFQVCAQPMGNVVTK